MKKIISVLLVLAILFSTATVAFAQSKNSYAPVIYVTGMANTSLVLDKGLETEKQVFGAEEEDMNAMIMELIFPAVFFLLGGSYETFAKSLVTAVEKVFEYIKYDADGEPMYNVSLEDENEVKSGYNTFLYDWRKDPMLVADELNSFILDVKEYYNSEKVCLVAESMGGVMTSAYIYKYGYESIETIIYRSSAMYGLTLIGELFTNRVNLKSDVIANYINGFLFGSSSDMIVYRNLIRTVGAFVVSPLVNKLDRFINYQGQYIYDEFLIEVFGHLPGLWSFVPDEYYEEAKAFMLDEQKNAELIEKIDVYHYQVRPSINSTIKEMEADGVNVAFISHYGFWGVPATDSGYYMSDALIDTKFTSGGAICSDINSTLGEDYVQAVNDEHNHISVDNQIDASTCLLPEKTWIVKGMLHAWHSSDYRDLVLWILTEGADADIYSNERFPQFLCNNEDDGATLPLTQENMNIYNDEVTFDVVGDFLKGIFS